MPRAQATVKSGGGGLGGGRLGCGVVGEANDWPGGREWLVAGGEFGVSASRHRIRERAGFGERSRPRSSSTPGSWPTGSSGPRSSGPSPSFAMGRRHQHLARPPLRAGGPALGRPPQLERRRRPERPRVGSQHRHAGGHREDGSAPIYRVPTPAALCAGTSFGTPPGAPAGRGGAGRRVGRSPRRSEGRAQGLTAWISCAAGGRLSL
jgi:hypothetical protein